MTQANDTETVRAGSCLCGAISFEVQGAINGVGQCHCSKCRKVSGTASNAMFIVGARRFRWTLGEQHTQRFRFPDGWGPTRCATCGSPLPESHDGKRYWVPAGLMNDNLDTTIGMHIHVASKADWDVIHDDALQHQAAAPQPPAS